MYEITSLLASLLVFKAALVAPTPITKPGAAACTEKAYAGDVLGGVSISEDGGQTWAVSYPVPGAEYIDAVVQSIYAVDDNIYVGTELGLAVSSDGGLSWSVQHLFDGDIAHQLVSSVFAANSRVWAVIHWSNSISISDDNGQTWPINSVLPNPFGYINGVCAVGGRTFASTYHGLGISDDDGNTWQYVGEAQGLASEVVTAVAADGDNVYAGTIQGQGTISISQDGGKTWRAQDTAPNRTDVNSLFTADGKVYVGTNGGGVSISEDGGNSWVVKTTADGLPSNVITSVAAVGNSIYVGTPKSLSISHDGGQTWATTATGSRSSVVTAVFAQCTIYVSDTKMKTIET